MHETCNRASDLQDRYAVSQQITQEVVSGLTMMTSKGRLSMLVSIADVCFTQVCCPVEPGSERLKQTAASTGGEWMRTSYVSDCAWC